MIEWTEDEKQWEEEMRYHATRVLGEMCVRIRNPLVKTG